MDLLENTLIDPCLTYMDLFENTLIDLLYHSYLVVGLFCLYIRSLLAYLGLALFILVYYLLLPNTGTYRYISVHILPLY